MVIHDLQTTRERIKPLRVAWFTASPPYSYGVNSSGSWISALAEELAMLQNLDLRFIVLKMPKDGSLSANDDRTLFVSTNSDLNARNTPTKDTVDSYQMIVEKLKPDLIHVWGTEWCGAYMATKAHLKVPVIVSIQGIAEIWSQYVLGSRRASAILRWFTPHDLFAPSGLFGLWRSLKRAARQEHNALKAIRFAECATPYMEAWVRYVNPQAHVFSCPSVLRAAFYQLQWSLLQAQKRTIFLPDAFTTYKAFDVMLRAAILLVEEFPDLRIRVGGPVPRCGFVRTSGYERYIRHFASKSPLIGRVDFLGPLDTEGMAREMATSHCVAISSLIESQCLVMLEAMVVGAPLVVPFSGGMPDLFTHMQTAVGYPVGDHICMAHGIRRIFSDDSLAQRLSKEARAVAMNRHDPDRVVENMLSIYRSVCS